MDVNNHGSLQCDLHTHSVFSDGTYTPTEIIAEAKELVLIVALTDHNTAAELLGMEAVHSSYSPETIRLAEAIAAEYGLLSSGGSDFHGSVKPDISLGTDKGWHSVPAEVYFNLRTAWESL